MNRQSRRLLSIGLLPIAFLCSAAGAADVAGALQPARPASSARLNPQPLPPGPGAHAFKPAPPTQATGIIIVGGKPAAAAPADTSRMKADPRPGR